MTLKEMKAVNPGTVERSTLKQIDDVKIDPNDAKEEKIKSYFAQIGNPYCYLDGDIVIKISFSDTDKTFEDCMKAYLSGL